MFKLIVIGDSGIGKSCLMHRMCQNEFNEDHEVTVGVEFGSLLVRIRNIVFKMQIWDTAGQEAFQSIFRCRAEANRHTQPNCWPGAHDKLEPYWSSHGSRER